MLALARALVRGLAVLAALLSLTATALALEQAAGPGLAVDAHAVEQRCEIFVSRLGLIETEHAADLLQRGPDDLDVTSPSAALRVLVAEDNPTNQIDLAAVLERLGHSAVLCDNGADAVQRLRHEPFDVVLMDLHMPVMDGFDATRAMRALSAPAGAVRIIALSADAFKKSRDNAISAGMDGFLAKPVSIETLAAVLDER